MVNGMMRRLFPIVAVLLVLVLCIISCIPTSTPTPAPAPTGEVAETPSQAEITEPSQTPTAPVKIPAPIEVVGATPKNGITSIEGREQESSDNISGPVLSNDLIRDMKQARRSGDFDNVGLNVGETAVDFTLKDVDRNTVSLRGLLSEKPVVMVFGSFT